MRVAEAEILFVPGWMGSGSDHWQSRWQARLSTARRLDMPGLDAPALPAWVDALHAAVAAARAPVVFVAHSCGAMAVAAAASGFAPGSVAAAMLVAPPAPLSGPAVDAFIRENAPHAAAPTGFDAAPAARLPFPALLVASRTDPFCPFAAAERFAGDWGATLVDAGDAGHINAAAGYGPWPEGLLRLAALLKPLGAMRAH